MRSLGTKNTFNLSVFRENKRISIGRILYRYQNLAARLGSGKCCQKTTVVVILLLMCGASGLNDFSVSYSGVKRDFAAFVKKYSDDRQLKVAIYNFASQGAERKADTVGLIP